MLGWAIKWPAVLPNSTTSPHELTEIDWEQLILLKTQGFLRHNDFIQSKTSELSFPLNGDHWASRDQDSDLKGQLHCSVCSRARFSFTRLWRRERWDKSDMSKYIFPNIILKCLDLYFTTYISKTIFVTYLDKCPAHKRHSIHIDSVHYCSHNEHRLSVRQQWGLC